MSKKKIVKKKVAKKSNKLTANVVAYETTEGNKIAYYFKASSDCVVAQQIFSGSLMPKKKDGNLRASLSVTNIKTMVSDAAREGVDLTFKVARIVYLDRSNEIELGHSYVNETSAEESKGFASLLG